MFIKIFNHLYREYFNWKANQTKSNNKKNLEVLKKQNKKMKENL
jgi:hypothetical protein